jgi:hypothetical protein
MTSSSLALIRGINRKLKAGLLAATFITSVVTGLAPSIDIEQAKLLSIFTKCLGVLSVKKNI